MEEVWLDVAIIRCPKCGKLYADASWYVIEIGSDITCGICGTDFNTRRQVLIRALLKFIIKDSEVKEISVERYLPTT